jgi:hypothetical protein
MMEDATSVVRGRKFQMTSVAIAAIVLGSVAAAGVAVGGSAKPTRPIAINQTDGYGDGKVVAFSYGQAYECVSTPFEDRDYDGKVMAEDPDEFQTPRCQIGAPTGLDPTGDAAKDAEPLYVIVPFFDADGDEEAFTPAAAATLKGAFGIVPDAFDPTPGVPVQCPEPGGALSQQTGEFGTCTTHPSTLDLGPVLAALGIVPPQTIFELPTPNHSHIIDGKNFGSIWWRIVVVLVTDQAAWPDVDGTTGITSVKALRTAQANGQALGDVDSNFFLFFDSRELQHNHR